MPVILCLAFWALHHTLKEYHYRDVIRSLRSIPPLRALLALALTLCGYLVLTTYDTLALRYVRNPLPYKKIAQASFVSYAITHNLGLSFLTGGSVRFRMYSSWGLSAFDIAKVVAFCHLTVWLGFSSAAAPVFLFEPLAFPGPVHSRLETSQPIGVLFLCFLAAYGIWTLAFRRTLRLWGWEFAPPSPRIAIAQIAAGCMDWIFASAVFYVLLPVGMGLPYRQFLAMYLVSVVAGIISQVPGGLGVFDTLMLLYLEPFIAPSELAGTLISFRIIYYFLPLGVAGILLGAHEILERKESVRRVAQFYEAWAPSVVPPVFAFTTFAAGAILLFSGATPSETDRLAWLGRLLPLPLIEISHFAGSLAGSGLLLLSWGLFQRLDGAFVLAAGLLASGVGTSLLKGFDYEEASLLSIMLAALLPCRRHFVRKASLLAERFTWGWTLAILLAVAGSVWLGVFAHHHVEYKNELWWRFTLHGDAPRFMRASVGASALLIVFGGVHLLRAAPEKTNPPDQTTLAKVDAIVAGCPRTFANLVYLSDKAVLFNAQETAFIMYSIEERSWVAMGDPVGPDGELGELVWLYRELCARHDGWPVFYQVHAQHLPLYLDVGLALLKLGEEARVPLETFDLEGSARKGLRQTHRKAEREGCSFSVIPRSELETCLPRLKEISDSWLGEKNTREKGFSLAFFNSEYLSHFPAAVVWKEGRIVAFANVLLGAEREEMSIDLMRHNEEAPGGVMDYLFIELMLWGRREGYSWFNLGMAPLSGLENRALAPLWNRLGALVFRHGEHFYNFEGLRHFKDKFDPKWEPRYLASPGGLALPRILTHVASLISRGLGGIVKK